jgi:hypothetical protein
MKDLAAIDAARRRRWKTYGAANVTDGSRA